uniref:EaeI methyltransferase beta subunit n=1 Tax=Klebsiella aerogenes TaxID=548 RepID=O52510_KLEAE|nr:EaeI methyltransferase beta subunit [Klebsiella aerogenes]
MQNSSKKENLNGLLLKMFPDCSTATMDKTSKLSSIRWSNSGMAFRGEYWMQNTLEHPSVEEECTLSQVLETCAPLESFLNPEQLESLINRAKERGQMLPEPLIQAYQKQISILSSMQVLDEKQPQDLKQKDTGTTEKPTHLTQEEVQMLYVRRMLPSEYERLQGFPENWTLIDSEQ